MTLIKLRVFTTSEIVEFLQAVDVDGLTEDEVEDALEGYVEGMSEYNVSREIDWELSPGDDLLTRRELQRLIDKLREEERDD